MASVLLGPSERMLLKFQRRNIIESSGSSDDSDHHANDMVKMLDSKKGLVKLQTLIKINRILKYYFKNKNLEPVDKNLLKGILIRKPGAALIEEAMKKQVSIFQGDYFNRSHNSTVKFGSRINAPIGFAMGNTVLKKMTSNSINGRSNEQPINKSSN